MVLGGWGCSQRAGKTEATTDRMVAEMKLQVSHTKAGSDPVSQRSSVAVAGGP